MNARTYTRINEDFLDDHQIDVRNDIDIYEEVEKDVLNLLADKDVAINLCELPDSYYRVLEKDDLEDLIVKCVLKYGNDCNLNWIDVSQITNMNDLFHHSYFHGDISRWNVHNVVTMEHMFDNSDFDGNISQWDVRNVKMFNYTFKDSQFTGNISNWITVSAWQMDGMFMGINESFNSDLSSWKTGTVYSMKNMFRNSNYDRDIS